MAALIKNTFYSTLSNTLQSLANILIVVVLARPLGTEEFGRLLLAISFTSIFAIMVEFGFKWYATKEASQHPEKARSISGEIFNAQLLLAAGATVLAGLAMRMMAYPAKTMAVIALIWVSAVLVAFTQATRSFFRSLDMFPCDTTLNLVLLFALVLALLPSLLFRPTVVAFAASILLARIAYFATARHLFQLKVGRPDFHFSVGRGGRLLAATLAYGTQIMIFRLLLEWNTLVLYPFSGNTGVGLYQASFRFVLATMVVSDILQQAFFPVISRFATTDRRRFIKTSTTLNRYMLSSGAYIAGAFFIFAGELVGWVFGATYAPAAPVLRILAFAVMAFFLSSTPMIALTAIGRQGTRARASAVVLALHAAASFILIPKWGAQGAAWAMAGAFALYAALNSFFVFRSVQRLFFDTRSLLAVLLALGGIVAVWFLKDVSLLMGAAGYAAQGLLLFWVSTTGGEKKELLQALRISAPAQDDGL